MTKISYIHGVNSLEMPKRISTADIDLTALNAGELERYGNAEILYALADASTNPAEKQQLIADGNALLLGMGGSLEVQNYLAKQARNTGPGFEFSAVSGVGNIITDAANKVKKAVQAVVNKLLKELLPLAGPAFLYLWVPASVGGRTGAKRKRVLAIFRGICKATGMKESTALAAIEKGIIKRFKMSPAGVIANIVANKVNGHAAIGVAVMAIIAAVSAALPVVIKIVQAIQTARGKKGELVDMTKDDLPDPDEMREDFTPKGGNNSGGNNNSGGSTDNTPIILGGLALAALILTRK